MGRKSFIQDLDQDIVSQLHDEIRSRRYGDHNFIVEWLKGLGIKVSRSALHRYSAELKAFDGYSGTAGSFKLHSALNSHPSRDDNLVALYTELGEIEYKRQMILDKIREIVGNKYMITTDENQ